MDETILLRPGAMTGSTEIPDPFLTVRFHEDTQKRPTILVVPGGCYEKISNPATTMDRFYSMGFHVAAIHYRVYPAPFPAPFHDLARGIRLLRLRMAEQLNSNGRLILAGSSAGGHLSVAAAILQNKLGERESDDADFLQEIRPDALILSYPIIHAGSGTRFFHLHSFYRLLGDHAKQEQIDSVSWDSVPANFPPTFLWHTREDELVPVEHTLDFAGILQKAGIPYELHIFPRGPHGLGIGKLDEFAEVRVWTELARTWLKNMGFCE